MNIFKGILRCSNCGKNFKYITQRKISCYVCSGYSNYGSEFCTRRVIKENDLIDILKIGFNQNGIEWERNAEYISQHVKEIVVDQKGNIEIKYHKHPSTLWNENGILSSNSSF